MKYIILSLCLVLCTGCVIKNNEDRMKETQSGLPNGIKVVEYLGDNWFVIQTEDGQKFNFRHFAETKEYDLLLPYNDESIR